MKKLFSVVIPIYGNELNLPITVPYIMENYQKLFPEYDFELILVNDGSPDNSWEIMKNYQKQYPGIIRIASFVRNFGQKAATSYGLSLAKGDFVGVISCDLQDPFELFAEMLKKIETGIEFVGGRRASRNEKGISVICSKITHSLMHNIVSKEYPEGGCDFYVIRHAALTRYLSLKPRGCSSIIPMLEVCHGVTFIPYERKKRTVGKSGYSLSRKINGFISFFVANTYFPLRLMSVTGFLFAAIAFIYAAIIFVRALIKSGNPAVPGWTSAMILITFFSGLLLVCLGVIGEYLWRIYDCVKERPIYHVLYTPEDVEQGKGDLL